MAGNNNKFLIDSSRSRMASNKSRLILKIAMPTTFYRKKRERFTTEIKTETVDKITDLFVGHQYLISIEDLIRRAVKPENLLKCIRNEFYQADYTIRKANIEPIS